MSENLIENPAIVKKSDNLGKESQKLVYVHIPKEKTQDISHVKILPPKSSGAATQFLPLPAKIGSFLTTTGPKKETTVPSSFTITKTTKLSGSNLTFTSRPVLKSGTSKPLLGNTLTLSSKSPNMSMRANKPLKVSLTSNRTFSTPTVTSIFRAGAASGTSPSNVIVSQGTCTPTSFTSSGSCTSTPSQSMSGTTITLMSSGTSAISPILRSPAQVRGPSTNSKIIPKTPKSVILQSKIVTSSKTNQAKILPVATPARTSTPNKTVLSYGTLLHAGPTTSDNSGIKRDVFGTPKREGGCYNSFTPPPLILQSGNNAKKLGNKKSGTTTISIVTGKTNASNSGISVFPLSRTNVNKSNLVNFKISNGQIQPDTSSVKLDGKYCESRPLLLAQSSLIPGSEANQKQMSEDCEKGFEEGNATPFFGNSLPHDNQYEEKDILQEAMCAAVSDIGEEEEMPATNAVNSLSVFPKYEESRFDSQASNSQGDQKFNPAISKVSVSLQETIPVLQSKSIPISVTAPALMQGSQPLSTSGGNLPVSIQSIQGVVPVKVPVSSQAPFKSTEVPGLIIRTDSVTVRRKMIKEEERKELSKPDLSIIPILRNSSLELKSSILKSPRVSSLGTDSFIDNINQDAEIIEEKEPAILIPNADTFELSCKNSIKNENDGIEPKESDVKKLLDWKNGMGSLVGSDLKFILNEFDAVELFEDKALDDIKNQISITEASTSPKNGESCLEAGNTTLSLQRSPSIHIHHARKPNFKELRKEEEVHDSLPNTEQIGSKSLKSLYDICCCKNCGCYGLSSEFYKEKGNSFCTVACSDDYETKEAEWNKEKLRMEKHKQKIKKTKTCEKEPPQDIVEIKEAPEINIIPVEHILEPTRVEIPSVPEVLDVPKFQHPWQDVKYSFSWVKYLEHCGKNKGLAKAAPLKIWNEPFPLGKNLFKTGMKLEGIDPQHQSLFCVMTVADVVGQKIRLHFDGYPDIYDFWCNANSSNIFQVGWCEKNGRKLETPPGLVHFSWKAYLEHCNAIPSPRQAFATRNISTVTSSNFRIGMKLEAEDRKNGWTCVATIADVLDNKILVHFDGWDKAYDIWFDVTSPYIYPIGWCLENGVYLYPPKDYTDPDNFNWHEYLQETNSIAVPARAFKMRLPKEFKKGMKIEAVDKRNPMLIRVATVADTKDYKICVHFDGWPDTYDFWVDDDSPDIHPPTWCSKTGHPLQPPLTPEQCAEDVDSGVGCGTLGCKGYGHVKGLIYSTHHTAFGCPYSIQNLDKDWESIIPDRLDPPSKEKKKLKGNKKQIINLDKSKPYPIDQDEDSQKKRIRKRRKFFDELSPPECSKSKLPRMSSEEIKISGNASLKPSIPVYNATISSCPSPSNSVPTTTPSTSEVLAPKKLQSSQEEVSVDTMVHQSIFNPGYHPKPPAPLPHTTEIHKHIISAIKDLARSDLEKYSPEEVKQTIAKIPGCEIASNKFTEQDIDGESFFMLTQNDLIELLGIKLGPTIKIMAMLVNLKNSP